MSKYWLHRISASYDVSYSLLMKGYITLGWSLFADTDILKAARETTTKRFEIICEDKGCSKTRARWSMWYFAQFSEGDIIVVPTARGKFSICRIIEQAKSISSFQHEIGNFTSDLGKQVSWDNGRLSCESQIVDVGFAAKVEFLQKEIYRSEYADAALTARMKMRQTNGEITNRDLCISVDNAAALEKPIRFYDAARECAKALLKPIKKLRPDQFEKLVQAYMKRIGADDVYIPAKNEHGKSGDADADVVAVFNALKLAVLIQVKHHEGITDKYALKQIYEYVNQLKDPNSELNYDYDEEYQILPWVLSSAAEYDEDAKSYAKENSIRLINGIEFAEMLLDVGIVNLNI